MREAIAIQEAIHVAPNGLLGNLSGIPRASWVAAEEAEAARRQSLDMLRHTFGDDHPYVAGTLSSLGDILLREQKFGEAEAAFRESLTIHRRTLSKGNPATSYALTGLGRTLLAAGRARDALPYLREGYELRAAGLPEGHWQTAASALALGECLTALGKPREALPYLRSARTTLDSTFGATDARSERAKAVLDTALRALGEEATDSIPAR